MTLDEGTYIISSKQVPSRIITTQQAIPPNSPVSLPLYAAETNFFQSRWKITLAAGESNDMYTIVSDDNPDWKWVISNPETFNPAPVLQSSSPPSEFQITSVSVDSESDNSVYKIVTSILGDITRPGILTPLETRLWSLTFFNSELSQDERYQLWLFQKVLDS